MNGVHEPGAELALPDETIGVVILAGGPAAATTDDPAAQFLLRRLRESGLATTAVDPSERDSATTASEPVNALAERLALTADRLSADLPTAGLPLGVFGAGTGGGAALLAAAERPALIRALVSSAGVLDGVSGAALGRIEAAALLVVGDRDPEAIEIHRSVEAELRARGAVLEIIAGADHSLSESSAVELVADLAASWFRRQLGFGMPATAETAGA